MPRLLRALFLCLLVVGIFATPLLVRAAVPRPSEPQAPRFGTSSLEGGVQGFLERRGSGLASMLGADGQPAGVLIEHITWYYNIDARIVLGLLESEGGLISAATIPVTATERPLGPSGPAGFDAHLTWAARELRAGLGPYPSDLRLTFTDGTSATVPSTTEAHEMTVKRFLAQGRTQAQWHEAVARYTSAYERLFKDEPVAAPATPPASRGFLSAPWYPGTRVIHSSHFDHMYPMVDQGGDGNDIMINSEGRTGLSYNGHDGHDYYFPDAPYGTPLIAAAPGWAFARTTRGLGVVIQHTGEYAGYETVYWHLDAFPDSFSGYIDSSEPRWVERGELLGWSGATGFTDGAPHLHFEVRHNGKQVDPYGWYGPGSDPCTAYAQCAPSIWLWDDSVSWQRPDAAKLPDTTSPQGLLTLNPRADVLLALQFEAGPLAGIGPLPASDQLRYDVGRFGQAARIDAGSHLTFPASTTVGLEQGTFAMWVNVPNTWLTSPTGRHYLLAASANPADPARIYSNTLALRHETRGPDDAPSWTFWTVDERGVEHKLAVEDTLSAGWHHIAISWDRKSGRKVLALDGAVVAQADGVTLPTSLGRDLEIGRWTYGAGESNIYLDEVLSFSRALPVDEISALAQAEAAFAASSTQTSGRDLVILAPAFDNGGGVVQVQLGLNGTELPPMPYTRAYRWTLPGQEGSYTLTLRLADRVGNTTLLTETITLNNPPDVRVAMKSLTPLTATLALSATDATPPIEIALSQSPEPYARTWEPLVAERIWTWEPMRPKRLYIWFRDGAGAERGPYIVGPDLWRAYLPRIQQ